MGAEEEEETAVGTAGAVAGGGGEGGDDAAEKGERPAAVVPCSICLDAVITGGEERSTARLQCGHEFHLGECLVASKDLSLVPNGFLFHKEVGFNG
jgi:hypothetical protein